MTRFYRMAALLVFLHGGCARHDSTTPQPTNTAETPMESSAQKGDEWPFESPRNLAVITLDRIMDDQNPILYVAHDEEDGGWQFLDGGDVNEKAALIVALAEVVQHDPTIGQLADLPAGWYAVRESLGKPWQRSPQQ